MSYDEIAYFQERSLEERERAANAASPIAAEIHLSLAIRYEALTWELRRSPTQPPKAHDGPEDHPQPTI